MFVVYIIIIHNLLHVKPHVENLNNSINTNNSNLQVQGVKTVVNVQ